MNKYYTILTFMVLSISASGQTTHKVTVAINQGAGCPVVTGLDHSDLIKISPNPAESSFVVKSTIDHGKIFLIDLNGKQVKEGTLTNGVSEMDVHDLPSGVYVLRIVSPKAVEQVKISVQ